MITLSNVHKFYGDKANRVEVLKGVSASIAEGEMVSVMGSSGSGKSTLLNILGLLDTYDQGRYQLAGMEISKGLTESQAAYLRNQFIGFVFQSFNLLPFKSAAENVALPLYYQKVGRKERNRRARQLLDTVGLGDRVDHMPNELSGGQKQRVAIARALITNPKVIFADEPTGALDSATTKDIMALFKEVHRQGNTLVIVTHEHDIAAQTDRLILLKDGRIEGSKARIDDLKAPIDDLKAKVDDLKAPIDHLKAKVDDLKATGENLQ